MHSPYPFPSRITGLLLTASAVLLQACALPSLRGDANRGLALRQYGAAQAAANARTTPSNSPANMPRAGGNSADGLKLARLLRDQGRLEGATLVYAQLDQRGELQPLEQLEYASVASQVRTPAESLALFGHARRVLNSAGTPMTPAATATLCNGLGRARMALGQTDAAFSDFDCTLAVAPDNVQALNAKGVLLSARGQHDSARQLLQRALELDPADMRVLNNLALAHLASGETAQAIRLFAQTESPQWPTLRLNLAFAQALQGDEERARQTLAAIMSNNQVALALDDFRQRRQRIREGAPLAEELLAASRRLLPLNYPEQRRG